MGNSIFKIATVPIKNPSAFSISRYKISNVTRLANGDAIGDEVAKKLKFFFTYAALTERELTDILALIWENSGMFFRLDYIENDIAKHTMVYAGEIPANLHRDSGGTKSQWIWKDVNFNLIER